MKWLLLLILSGCIQSDLTSIITDGKKMFTCHDYVYQGTSRYFTKDNPKKWNADMLLLNYNNLMSNMSDEYKSVLLCEKPITANINLDILKKYYFTLYALYESSVRWTSIIMPNLGYFITAKPSSDEDVLNSYETTLKSHMFIMDGNVMKVFVTKPSDPLLASTFKSAIESTYIYNDFKIEIKYVYNDIGFPSIVIDDSITSHVKRESVTISLQSTDKYNSFILAHEFGHILGFFDCYVEYFDLFERVVVYYTVDEGDLMCSSRGVFNERRYEQLMNMYRR